MQETVGPDWFAGTAHCIRLVHLDCHVLSHHVRRRDHRGHVLSYCFLANTVVGAPAVVAAVAGTVVVDNIAGVAVCFDAGVEIGTNVAVQVVVQQVFDSCPPSQGFAWTIAYCSSAVASYSWLLRRCW